ncbi:MAG: c-type cytochrome, partial [Pseudomonadota bacterium]
MFKHSIVAAAVLAAGLMSSAAFADGHSGGDAEKGKKVFNKCKSCHMVGEGAKNKVGPVLTGIIGRQAGSYPDMRYGKSLVEAGEKGLVWTEEEMFAYLKDPKKYLRAYLDDKKARSKMAYKLRKEDDRRDVIAYLKTFAE